MATFSVTDQTRRAQYTANGSTTEFSFSFQVNNTSDIKVDVNGTTKTESTHYDIKTTANSNGLNTDGTGKVVFRTSPSDHTPANNEIVTIYSDHPLSRTSVYTSGGNITAASLENDFDTITMVLGSHEERMNRAIQAPVTDPVNVDLTLPIASTRASKIMGFDANGDFVVDSSSSLSLVFDTVTIGTILATSDLEFRPSGGQVNILGTSGQQRITFNNDSTPTIDIYQNSNITTLAVSNPSANRTITFPDTTGTVALTSQLDLVNDTTPQLGGTLDLNGNRIEDSTTVTIKATGSADIDLQAAGGQINILDGTGTQRLQFNNDSTPTIQYYQNSNNLILAVDTLTGARTLTLPDATDTLVGKATTDTLTNKTLTNPTVTDLVLNNNITGTAVLDQDDMSSNSATKLATQQSIKAYVDSQVASVPQGDITGVVAGTGLTGGGLSGTVSLNINATTGLTATSSTLSIDSTVVTKTGTQTLTNKTLTSPIINTGVSGTAVKDEDDMVSNSSSHLATQQSIKAYVDAQVAGGGAGNLSTVLGIGNTTAGNNIVFGDSSGASDDRLVFGDGTDLSIYHDGSHSYIDEQGTGSLQIKATNLNIKSSTNETYIACVADGQVELNYDNSTKLATTSTGVDVTGTVTADDVSIADTSPTLLFNRTDRATDNKIIRFAHDGEDFQIQLANDAVSSVTSAIAINRTGMSLDSIVFYEDTGTTPKFFWDASAERLGIGTTNPFTTLEVESAGASLAGLTSHMEISHNSLAADTGGALVLSSNNNRHGAIKGGSNSGGGTGYLSFYTRPSSGDLSERMRIDSSGNVAIGRTSSISHPLDIQKATDAYIRVSNATTQEAAGIIFANQNTSKFTIEKSGSAHSLFIKDASGTVATFAQGGNVGIGKTPTVVFDVEGSTSGNWVSVIKNTHSSNGYGLKVTAGDNNDVEALRVANLAGDPLFSVKSGGSVGIGTTSPSGALHVKDATDINMANSVVGQIVIEGNAYSGGIALNASGMQIYHNSSARALIFGTNETERMRIEGTAITNTGSGSLPSASLQGFGVQDQTISTSATSTGTRNHHLFYNGNGQVGSIQTSGSSTSFNTSSDYRLKENVVNLTGATERLKQLEPKRFNFIADADTTVDGFLAHEVQDIVPEAITGTKDAVDADGNPDYQGIDQSKLVPLLVATIKELEARITALEAN